MIIIMIIIIIIIIIMIIVVMMIIILLVPHPGDRGGNKCRNPDFLGFSKRTCFLRGLWGMNCFVHLLLY